MHIRVVLEGTANRNDEMDKHHKKHLAMAGCVAVDTSSRVGVILGWVCGESDIMHACVAGIFGVVEEQNKVAVWGE